MTPSDWIAIGALVVACLTIIFNYLINKANIQARHAEIVAEKSLEAYRETVGKLQVFAYEGTHENIAEAERAAEDLLKTLLEYTLYFPIDLFLDVVDLIEKIKKAIENPGEHSWEDLGTKAGQLIYRIQKHIGVETKE